MSGFDMFCNEQTTQFDRNQFNQFLSYTSRHIISGVPDGSIMIAEDSVKE